MLLISILLLLLIGALAVWYKYFIVPKKLMKWQAEAFRKKGYKVLELEYNFFKPSLLTFFEDQKTLDHLAFAKLQAPKYDVVIFNAFNSIIVDILTSLQLRKQILSAEKTFIYKKEKTSAESITMIAESGVVFSEGQNWKNKRKVLNQVFNFDFIRMLAPKIAKICDDSLENLQKDSKTGKDQFTFQILKFGHRIAGSTMIQCFFTTSLEGLKLQNKHLSDYVCALVDESTKVGFSAPCLIAGMKIIHFGLTEAHRSLSRRIKLFRQWGRNFISERMKEAEEKLKKKEKQKPSDLIEALVFNQQKQAREKSVYDQKAILDEFFIFFLAGTETTSSFITVMILLLCLHPEVEEKVRAEIEEVMKNDDYSFENLKKCTYIDCVEKEAIRCYGPGQGLFFRESKQDTYLKDVQIKKGVLLSAHPIGFHFSDKYYKNPHEFRPDRWIEECDNIPPFAIGGFSGGPRTCIGKHLAKMESKIALIKFLKRYKNINLGKKDISEIKFTTSGLIYKPEPFNSTMSKS